MPSATTRFALPYPVVGDSPAVHTAIQSLAEAVDTVGLVGGKRRTADSAAITTTETIIVDTQSLSLAASSAFLIEFFSRIDIATDSAGDVGVRIRYTNTAGTELCNFNEWTSRQDCIQARMVYITTTSETRVFVGTLVRQNGTGTVTAKVPAHLLVWRLGPSSLVGTF